VNMTISGQLDSKRAVLGMILHCARMTNSTRPCDIVSDLFMADEKLYSYIAYGETLRFLWMYDLPVSRPRLPGLLAMLDGRRSRRDSG
jgi:hypothetical protein